MTGFVFRALTRDRAEAMARAAEGDLRNRLRALGTGTITPPEARDAGCSELGIGHAIGISLFESIGRRRARDVADAILDGITFAQREAGSERRA